MGVDDDTAIVAAFIAERLKLKGNPTHAAEAARDKHRQRQMLADARVPIPRFELHMLSEDSAEIAKTIRYPCVVKPLRLSASRGVIRADNPHRTVGLLSFRRAAIARACDWPGRPTLSRKVGARDSTSNSTEAFWTRGVAWAYAFSSE